LLEDIDVSPKVIQATLDALEILERRPLRPAVLSYAALERCLALGEIIRRDSIMTVSVRAQSREVRISEQLDAHVKEILGQKIEVLGSVQGELAMVTLRGRSYFNVYSLVTGKATRCYFDETVKEQVRQALGHVVSVRGVLRSFAREEGQEMTTITELRILPDEAQLPTPAEIRGIMPNLTGGKPSERYLKERWRGKP
jgi:hypothetical protein